MNDDLHPINEKNVAKEDKSYQVRLNEWLKKPMTHKFGPFTTFEHTGWHMIVFIVAIVLLVVFLTIILPEMRNKQQHFSVATGW